MRYLWGPSERHAGYTPHRARRTASPAMRSNVSFTKLFMMDMAFLEMPVSAQHVTQ